MTIADWLVDSMVRLQKAGVASGRTDSLVLLADLFNKDKSWVHAHPEHQLDDLQVKELEYKLQKRLNRIPLAYIRGFSEFYRRKFIVNSNVMIPRPESEDFINLLKDLQLETSLIGDVGTGSGCLGITAALEVPGATVHLYDISQDALDVANYNFSQYKLSLKFWQSDLLSNLYLDQPYDVLLVNLPYVPKDLITSPEITKEPAVALFSGEDGLSHYKKFWQQVSRLVKKPKYIFTESLQNQHAELKKLAEQNGYRLKNTEGLIQVFKN